MQRLLVLGFHSRSTAIAERELWHVARECCPDFLAALKKLPGLSEAVYLATCNRAEVYAVVDATLPMEKLVEVWRQFCPQGKQSSGPRLILFQEEAMLHLFRVTASLDSVVVGETEILGQVKNSYQMALQAKATGPWLNRLFQQSFASAKRVRTETGIGKHPVSVSTVAIKLAEKIFGELNGVKALVVGLGEMGRQTAQYLSKRGVAELKITNRTLEVAQTLAPTLAAQAIPFEEWSQHLNNVDVIVTCAGTKEPLVTLPMMKKILRERGGRPLFLIDLGMPRNIAAAVGSLESIFLYTVDHLQEIAGQNLALRQQEVESAQQLIEDSVQKMLERYREGNSLNFFSAPKILASSPKF